MARLGQVYNPGFAWSPIGNFGGRGYFPFQNHVGAFPGCNQRLSETPQRNWDMLKQRGRWKGIVCLAIVCWVPGLRAQSVGTAAPEAQLHEYLTARAANGDFSGTVAVERQSKLIYMESFGFADFENRTPFTAHSRFEIASITKTFTAAAISILLAQEKLTLDSTLDRFFPEFPRAHEITIRHLLSHGSGVGELPPGPWILQRHSLQQVVHEIEKQPFFFAPGKSDRYSNSGYVLLAAVIETVSGKSYNEFLQEQLFRPLGMTETGSFWPQEITMGRVHKYQPGPAPDLVWNVPVEDLSYSMGAGSASSTANDLLLWLRAARQHSLFRRPPGEYPYGWGKETYFKRAAIDQTGLHSGASAAILTFPAEELDVVCLSNTETGFFTSCLSIRGPYR
jgi:CubicO group peptidase (beta-lactamase class C family)